MTVVPTYLVDANVIIRFFVQDDRVKAAAAKSLVEQARKGKVVLEVPFTAISETAHTLRSFYGIDRSEIAKELLKFLKGVGISTSAPSWMLDALNECETRKVSFGDACMAAEARATGKAIASFDRDFDSFAGVVRFEPK